MSESGARPIAVSMGDPAGVGPELICRSLLLRPEIQRRVLVYGCPAALARASRVIEGQGLGHLRWVEANSTDPIPAVDPGVATVVSTSGLSQADLPKWGRISAVAGAMAAEAIRKATVAVLEGQACALVTAPIHKEALAAAGEPYPGHTEMLQAIAARYLGLEPEDLPVRMMLSSPDLRTVLMSIHVSLRKALEMVTHENLTQTLHITQSHFLRLGFRDLRIAVAGVNPHAGEGGLFGSEEVDILVPCIADANRDGMRVSGPHAPDTVYMRARQGEFDVVIAMYHDQGLIPVKYLGLEHGVNTTLGLPFLRTSPDHGTAFDLAGSGKASPDSFLEALDQAMAFGGRWINQSRRGYR